MGRKIPGKKHRGVKDPDKQRAKRLSELEGKINAPPKNIDEQDTPKSLERLIKLKNAAKSGGLIQKRRKKKKGSKLIKLGAEQSTQKERKLKGKPEKVVPIFDQKPGESNHQFWHRVNRETQAFIKETEFETKYNVQVKRNPETGYIEGVEKRPKDELDELAKLRAKHKNIKKKKKSKKGEESVALTKSQKRKQKLLQKKEKKHQNDVDEFKVFKDKVEFGEIVHAPPELKVHPKNAEKTANKVNCKGLLLTSLLKENESSKSDKEKTKLIDRTGKRKDLPIGERRQLEKQQNDVIAAYRQLKARKFMDSSIST